MLHLSKVCAHVGQVPCTHGRLRLGLVPRGAPAPLRPARPPLMRDAPPLRSGFTLPATVSCRGGNWRDASAASGPSRGLIARVWAC